MGVAAVAQGALAVTGTALELQDNQVEGYQNQINLEENKRLALQAAADAVIRGSQEAARTRMAATQMMGRQKVAFGASGVDATVGTAAQVQAGTRMMSELDALTLENNAVREAWGYRSQAEHFGRQAKLDELRYQNQQLGTALGGVGRVGSSVAGGIK